MKKSSLFRQHTKANINRVTLTSFFALTLSLFGTAIGVNYSTYHLYKNLNDFSLTLCASFISAALSLLLFLRCKINSPAPTKPRQALKQYLIATLCAFFTWTSGFAAIHHINPAVALAIAVSILPIFTALKNIKKVRGMNLITGLVTLTTAFMLATWSGSGIQCTEHDEYQLEIGVFFSILCGASFHFGTGISKRLKRLGHSSLKINAVRSTLTFAMCAAIGFSADSFNIMLDHVDQLIIFSLFFMLPIHVALLLSIKTIGVRAVAVGISAVPLCTLLVQVTLFQLRVNSFMAALVVANALVLIFMSYRHLTSARRA